MFQHFTEHIAIPSPPVVTTQFGRVPSAHQPQELLWCSAVHPYFARTHLLCSWNMLKFGCCSVIGILESKELCDSSRNQCSSSYLHGLGLKSHLWAHLRENERRHPTSAANESHKRHHVWTYSTSCNYRPAPNQNWDISPLLTAAQPAVGQFMSANLLPSVYLPRALPTLPHHVPTSDFWVVRHSGQFLRKGGFEGCQDLVYTHWSWMLVVSGSTN